MRKFLIVLLLGLTINLNLKLACTNNKEALTNCRSVYGHFISARCVNNRSYCYRSITQPIYDEEGYYKDSTKIGEQYLGTL